MFSDALATQSTMEWECWRGFPQVFRNPLVPVAYLSACLSSRGVGESISVAIPSDHIRKKGVMMTKANVSHCEAKMDKMMRRRGLPCVRRSSALYKGRAVRGAV
jgi:hypothetical protein